MLKASKRAILFLAVLQVIMALALVGCGGGSGTSDTGSPTTPIVTVNQPSGTTFTDSITVTLNVTPSDALVTYTTDGTNPNVSSTVYTTPLTFTQNTSLKVYAAKGTATATYTFVYTKVQNSTTTNETLMQGFYWEIQNDPALWTVYTAKADELKAMGITMLWIPPAYKAAGLGIGSVNSNGYDVYDHYDLGEFYQKGTTRTKFGTKDQLVEAVTALHNSGIKVIADVVLNHKMGADAQDTPTGNWSYTGNRVWTNYTFSGRGDTYSSFKWNWTDFNGVDYVDGVGSFNNGVLLPGKQWNSTFAADFLMGCNIDYNNTDVQNEMKAWGKWFVDTLDLDGFRVDAIQHVKTSYAGEWIDSIRSQTGKELWTVGEMLDGNRTNLQNFLSLINHKMKLFDFDLYYWFRNHQSAPDFRAMTSQGLVNTSDGADAVTFADNHDTNRVGDSNNQGITSNKEFLYAYILTLDKGVPCVWWKDYYVLGMKSLLDPMLKARKDYAYGKGTVVTSGTDYYVYLREGTSTSSKDGLILVMSRGGAQTVRVNTKHSNMVYMDLMGNSSSNITTDGNGAANFTTPSGKISIWVPKN